MGLSFGTSDAAAEASICTGGVLWGPVHALWADLCPSMCSAAHNTEINPRAAGAEQALLRLLPTCVNISKTYFGDGKLVNLEMTGN